jgi:hypothetical protein
MNALRLGISGAALALIACGVWFITTNQASEVQRRAFEARDASLAALRAAQNGVSVEEMKRRAYAGCNFQVAPNTHADDPGSFDLFQRDRDIASRDADRSSCIGSYIYGDGLMNEPMLDLFEQWLLAVLKIVFISVGAGAVIAAIFKGAQSWWGWLRTN